MVVKNTRNVRALSNGMFRVLCDIQSDTLPVQMPAIGAEVDGMDDMAEIDVASTLEVLEPHAKYVMGQDLEWHEIPLDTGGADIDDILYPFPSAQEFKANYDKYHVDAVEAYNAARPREWPRMPPTKPEHVYYLFDMAPGDKLNFDLYVGLSGALATRGATVSFGHVDEDGEYVVDSIVSELSTSGSIVRITRENDGTENEYPILEVAANSYTVISTFRALTNVRTTEDYETHVVDIDINTPNASNVQVWGGRQSSSQHYDCTIAFAGVTAKSLAHNGNTSYGYEFPETLIGIYSLDGMTRLNFKGCHRLEFLPDIDDLDLTYLSFGECKSLICAPKINFEKLTSFLSEGLFSGCTSIRAFCDSDEICLPRIENIASMFMRTVSADLYPKVIAENAKYCNEVFSESTVKNLYIKVSGNGAKMSQFAYNAIDLESATIILTGDAHNIDSANSMLYGCYCLRNVKIIAEDGSDITIHSAKYSFSDCDISGVSAIEYLKCMPDSAQQALRGISSLVRIGDEELRLENAAEVFNGCKHLKSVGNLRFPNSISLSSAFRDLDILSEVGEIYMPETTSISYMFSGCSRLKKLGRIAPEKPVSMDHAFYACNNLEEIQVAISAVGSMAGAFSYSSSYNYPNRRIDGEIDLSGATDMQYAFSKSGMAGLTLTGSSENVTNFISAFEGANVEELGEINMSAAKTFYRMLSSEYIRRAGPLTGLGTVEGTGYENGGLVNSSGTASSPWALEHLSLDPSVTGWTGKNAAINIKYCSFDHDGLVDLFESLPAITGTNTITITGNPGADKLFASEIEIATAKNWNIVGATNIIDDREPEE